MKTRSFSHGDVEAVAARRQDLVTALFLHLVVGVVALIAVFPFVFTVIISFTKESSIVEHGYRLIPAEWSAEAYRYIIETGDQLVRSLGVSVFVTVVGTVVGVMVMAMYAYAISRKEFRYRRIFTFLIFFTMLFNGGLVPTYIVVTQVLRLQDTVWALIVPLLMDAFFVLVLRTFFQTSIPDSLLEAARIDGAGELYTFFRVVLPLSLPGMATVALFTSLRYWNDWLHALLYIETPQLVPLQSLLMKVQNNLEFMVHNASLVGGVNAVELLRNLPAESVRMAMVVVITFPLLFVYPFFQRYFVQGLTVGSIKG